MSQKKISTHGQHLHALVRAHRIAAGLSITELADRIGISRSTLSGWEHGTRVCNLNDLERIAAALGKTAAEILAAEPGSATWRVITMARVLPDDDLEMLIRLAEALQIKRRSEAAPNGALPGGEPDPSITFGTLLSRIAA